ncbi:MAG: hypothetical protein HOC20_03070 [Chloroflexi bacterium]|jgi:hypothetical protein|nr:hypothetical protein [Chloroflexota bacterium]
MLTNLKVKSNLLPGRHYQERFDQLSAMELRSIKDRLPLMHISFTPGRYSLTPKQAAEWDARLFWGDETVSMKTGDMATKWVRDLVHQGVQNWKEYRKNLRKELAFEWLWLFEELRAIDGEIPREIEAIIGELTKFLLDRNYSEPTIRQRLHAFNPRAFQMRKD